MGSVLRLSLSAFAICAAVYRWVWFQNLPKLSTVRQCEDCFLAIVGVPTETGLLGLLIVLASVFRVHWVPWTSIFWCSAMAGVVLTPFAVGMPLFLGSYLALVYGACLGFPTRHQGQPENGQG
jgi:hypothetical protein